jgi:hypothetical protein
MMGRFLRLVVLGAMTFPIPGPSPLASPPYHTLRALLHLPHCMPHLPNKPRSRATLNICSSRPMAAIR